MGFFKNVGTESVILCKKLANFNDLKSTDIQDISPWSWPIIYIMQNVKNPKSKAFLLNLCFFIAFPHFQSILANLPYSLLLHSSHLF